MAMVCRDQRDHVEGAELQPIAPVTVQGAPYDHTGLVRGDEFPPAYPPVRVVVDLDTNSQVCAEAGGDKFSELVTAPGRSEFVSVRLVPL